MGSVTPPTSGDNNAQRRSQRVMIKVSGLVLAEGAENKPVSEETRTVIVNAHGCNGPPSFKGLDRTNCSLFAIREREKKALAGRSM